jgi:sugar phosphate isomerase/epimerase
LDRFRGPPPTSATDQDITPALRRIREALDYYDVALAAWCCVPVFDVAYRSRGAVKAIRQALVTAGRLSSDLVCATIDAASLAENPAPAIDRLGVLAVDAERLGVRLALVWKGEDPTAVLGILQGIASPWLGLCQSPPVEEMPPPEVVSQLVARTLHVELRLAREDAAGDYRPWLEVLRAAGYRGAVALNASRAADVAAALRNGVAMVRRYA